MGPVAQRGARSRHAPDPEPHEDVFSAGRQQVTCPDQPHCQHTGESDPIEKYIGLAKRFIPVFP